MRVLLCALAMGALLTASQVHAEPSLWVSAGGVSLHSRSGSNGNNTGLMLEAEWSDDWSAVAGRLRNSINQRSTFAAAKYTPWRTSAGTLLVKAGLFAGAIDGYRLNHGRFVPLGGLVTEVGTDRVRLAAMLIPPVPGTSAALLITLKVRLQ